MVDVPWLGPCIIGPRIGTSGYARYPSGKRGDYLYAHRVEWEKAHGPIPEGMHIHHRCGTKACINVDHMELLTPSEHHATHGAERRKCNHEDRYVRPDGRTRCRICSNAAENARQRQRYRTDPEYREKRKAAEKDRRRRRREEVMACA
jgi:hypothetical protein